mmetsp:Transcript_23396/g.63434  ORF Transcript_23396/g.63434 Transcript_23396/m.63434 type:complete len:216 (+) Transcript_23396:175-822(+)
MQQTSLPTGARLALPCVPVERAGGPRTGSLRSRDGPDCVLQQRRSGLTMLSMSMDTDGSQRRPHCSLETCAPSTIGSPTAWGTTCAGAQRGPSTPRSRASALRLTVPHGCLHAGAALVSARSRLQEPHDLSGALSGARIRRRTRSPTPRRARRGSISRLIASVMSYFTVTGPLHCLRVTVMSSPWRTCGSQTPRRSSPSSISSPFPSVRKTSSCT